MAALTGTTTGNLRLRAGPGTDHPTLAFLLPGTKLEILQELELWLQVVVDERSGYVSRRFVAIDGPDASLVPTPERDFEIEPEDDTAEAGTASFTTGYVNFRAGPGTDQTIIRVLIPNTQLEIIGEEGAWLRVRVGAETGFVHRNFVSTAGGTGRPAEFVPFDSQIEVIDFRPIPIRPEFTGTERVVAGTWNTYGGMLTKFAQDIQVDVAVVAGLSIAVLFQESGGSGFRNGKLLIRFENHLFDDNWGKHSDKNRKKFDQHFTYGPGPRWGNHMWRKKSSHDFQAFHGNQTLEWQVLEFASKLDDTAAKKSISMGMPQILGLNHFRAGFSSVQQMFNVFSIDNQQQLTGFFTFIRNTPSLLRAIREKDYLAFSTGYNGGGQAEKYKRLIEARIVEFEAMHTRRRR